MRPFSKESKFITPDPPIYKSVHYKLVVGVASSGQIFVSYSYWQKIPIEEELPYPEYMLNFLRDYREQVPILELHDSSNGCFLARCEDILYVKIEKEEY